MLFFHVTLFLLSQWSVRIKCCLGHKKEADIKKSNVLYVKAAKNAGNDRIVKLFHNTYGLVNNSGEIRVANTVFTTSNLEFEFQKVTYNYDENKNTFHRLEYPTVGNVKDFLSTSGYHKSDELNNAIYKWGLNDLDVPIPTFSELYTVRMYLSSIKHALQSFNSTYLFSCVFIATYGSSILRIPSYMSIIMEFR